MSIDDKASWWAAASEHWDWLLAIIAHHMDVNSPAYDPPGRAEGKLTGRTILEEVLHLRETKQGKVLCRYLNAAWGLASEAYAWSVPAWGVLCDLCSEEWALYDCQGCGACAECQP